MSFSPSCQLCVESMTVYQQEDKICILHIPYIFWKQVGKWIQSMIATTLHLAVLDVLFGIVNADTKYYYLHNYVILTAKYFIFTTKKQNEDLFFWKFLHTLKMKLQYLSKKAKQRFLQKDLVCYMNLSKI